ncbi:MAG: peptidoglycan editing factor PgeF [Alphaproteobacteria bacterium]|nr:peptidoglycan editing factor PgeF [Alphaproteobacteria bacterium]
MDLKSALQVSEPEEKSIYYQTPGFLPEGETAVFHGFFGRQGGVSKGVYNALNCGPGSDDAIENVRKNLEIVAGEAGISAEAILLLHQVHGKTCLKVESPWTIHTRPEADAHVTDKPGLALGILTADCTPVLFYARKNDGTPVIGAAHAGWKGALGGVLASTVEQIKSYGIETKDISAAIGPCIGQVSYEIGPEMFETIVKDDERAEKFFKSSRREDRFMFDLAGYCALKLADCGLANIVIKDLDTYFNEEDFFSYRRTTHRGDKDYGRQISLIVIKD